MMKLLAILALIIVVGVGIFGVVAHEESAKQINRIAGVDSEITYFPPRTTATNYTNQDLTNLELAHAQNDIVGYQIMPVLIFIFILMIIQLFILISILKVRNDGLPYM